MSSKGRGLNQIFHLLYIKRYERGMKLIVAIFELLNTCLEVLYVDQIYKKIKFFIFIPITAVCLKRYIVRHYIYSDMAPSPSLLDHAFV